MKLLDCFEDIKIFAVGSFIAASCMLSVWRSVDGESGWFPEASWHL